MQRISILETEKIKQVGKAEKIIHVHYVPLVEKMADESEDVFSTHRHLLLLLIFIPVFCFLQNVDQEVPDKTKTKFA